MRREWSGWIRTRQWSEFEKLAKVDPSQGLADTVAELELGFPEKADRRALRKVLYLLSQAGFEPREIEEYAANIDVPIAPMEAAFMVSSDGLGDTVITFGREERGRFGWITAHLNYRIGVTRAVEDASTLDEANARLIRLRNLNPDPFISSEVPVEFALSRLAYAVSITKNLPPVMAYWRASLPKEISHGHPTDTTPRKKQTDEAMKTFLQDDDATQTWRLEMGSLAPVLSEFFDERLDPEMDEQTTTEKWQSALKAARSRLFVDETIADHRTRLLDLAYLSHLKGLSFGDILLALADNLLELGTESVYAEHITTKSMLIYIHTLRTANEADRAKVKDREPRD